MRGRVVGADQRFFLPFDSFWNLKNLQRPKIYHQFIMTKLLRIDFGLWRKADSRRVLYGVLDPDWMEEGRDWAWIRGR